MKTTKVLGYAAVTEDGKAVCHQCRELLVREGATTTLACATCRLMFREPYDIALERLTAEVASLRDQLNRRDGGDHRAHKRVTDHG